MELSADRKLEKLKLSESNYAESSGDQAETAIGKEESREKLRQAIENNPDLKTKYESLVVQMKALIAIKHMRSDPYPIEIYPDLYIGSIGAALSKKNLEATGITHVLSVVDQIKLPYSNDFGYKQVSVLDKAETDIKKHFRECGRFINEALSQDGKKVLVHCFAGISRSTTVLIAYLMEYKGMKRDDALKMIREKRSIVNPNPGFMIQLKQFEEQLFASDKKSELA